MSKYIYIYTHIYTQARTLMNMLYLC